MAERLILVNFNMCFVLEFATQTNGDLFFYSINEKTGVSIKGNPPGEKFFDESWNSQYIRPTALFRAPGKGLDEEEKSM